MAPLIPHLIPDTANPTVRRAWEPSAIAHDFKRYLHEQAVTRISPT